MRYGNITPTDLDGLIEYRNIAWFINEFKLHGQSLPLGQRLALERLCDDLDKSGKVVVVFICEHNTPLEQDIDCANTRVVAERRKGRWSRSHGETLKQATDRWLDFAVTQARLGPPPAA